MKLLHVLRSVLGAVGPSVIVILVLEIVLRVGAYAWNGGSQYYLLYGLHGLSGRVGVSPWWVYDGGHYKFPPNYTLHGAAGQGTETASTNSRGFRGPEFEPHKPPNTFRIITLGGSSTFGYHNSDAGTYPYLLGQLMRERRNPVVEVINAGFPYYNTGSMRSLLTEELWGYEPDLITLYAAYNDTSWPLEVGPLERAVVWVQQHSMIYLFLKNFLITDQRVYKLRSKLMRWFPQAIDTRAMQRRVEGVAARYRANVEAIADMAEDRGVQLVLIRQPITALYRNPEAFPSYEAEFDAVEKKLADGEPLDRFEFSFLIHQHLIQVLDAIAQERGLPVVDNIAIVDRNRSRLTSWVHLTEEANLRLAEAIRDTIGPYIEIAGRERTIDSDQRTGRSSASQVLGQP